MLGIYLINNRRGDVRNELRLNLQRHVAHFVQKQRAFVGEFQPSDLLADGAGERSLLMSKPLILEEPRRNRRAINLNERAVFAPAMIVNRARDEFLSDFFSVRSHREEAVCPLSGKAPESITPPLSSFTDWNDDSVVKRTNLHTARCPMRRRP
jgi:hypothetical protein